MYKFWKHFYFKESIIYPLISHIRNTVWFIFVNLHTHLYICVYKYTHTHKFKINKVVQKTAL